LLTLTFAISQPEWNHPIINGRSHHEFFFHYCERKIHTERYPVVVCYLWFGADRASIPLEHVRHPRNTPTWKLEAALKCRSCRTPRHSSPVHMIKLTQQREIALYALVHPDDDERR
jgi:hypothetical protein